MKLYLRLINHYVMYTYGGVEVYLQAFLTSVLYGGDWSDSRSGHFTPEEKAPGTLWMGVCVGFRDGLDAVAEINTCP